MRSGRVSSRGMPDTHALRGVASGLPCRFRAEGCSRSARRSPLIPKLPKQLPKRLGTTRAKRVSAWINGVKSGVKR